MNPSLVSSETPLESEPPKTRNLFCMMYMGEDAPYAFRVVLYFAIYLDAAFNLLCVVLGQPPRSGFSIYALCWIARKGGHAPHVRPWMPAWMRKINAGFRNVGAFVRDHL